MRIRSLKEERFKTGAILFIAAALFVLSQIFYVVHAAKYGDESHEHFGHACVIAHVSGHGDKFVASAAVAAIAIVFTFWGMTFSSPRAALSVTRIHAMRSRGPPNQ